MSSLPQPPTMHTNNQRTPLSPRGNNAPARVSLARLPPPPPPKQQSSNYAQNLVKSMTIDEMRELHRRALSEAESKQTELRLVLASRYRELVGSSDAVTKMFERSEELHGLVHALPELMEKLINSTTALATEEDSKAAELTDLDGAVELRHKLSHLPKLIHRALDRNHVHQAAESLLDLCCLIATQTDEYALATALASGVQCRYCQMDDLLRAQMRMTFMHVQTLPAKIIRISKDILNQASSYGIDPNYGAQRSASALSTLDLLDVGAFSDRSVHLLDLYFDSKARLLQGLLAQLTSKEKIDDSDASNAEDILSKIVLILQYDIVLHPYQMFVLRMFPTDESATSDSVMKSLPIFSAQIVQTKATNFLSAHLPLVRTKVKTVLVDIAGTTASALGKIRQSLYDKTDGGECKEALDSNGFCTWEEAVAGVVDVPSVLSSTSGNSMAYGNDGEQKLSLWSVLFSNTFSSLVHSLLTTTFQSVHSKVVTALRLSLAHAPSLASLLPHEAYRNTLYIASELDTALLKLSEDAHELLVHAEERAESETRLKQSLYVQTCEIMGRLICELRRMLSENSDAVKDLIVGRLCHLLKFRLTALPTLVDPRSSPAVLQGTSGMISLTELASAFDLADDDEDGLITFKEAMEAVDSAFSGTQFHGAEMVRETLLLAEGGTTTANSGSRASQDVTLNELTLLLARGLRHEAGDKSALGCIQASLDQITSTCFAKWATAALTPSMGTLSLRMQEFVQASCSTIEPDYQRVFGGSAEIVVGAAVNNVSSHIIDFLLQVSFTLNRSACPSDALEPVPSRAYAVSVGIDEAHESPCLFQMMRWALLSQSLHMITSIMTQHIGAAIASSELKKCGPSALVQLKNDLSFVGKSFFRRNKYGFRFDTSQSEQELRTLSKEVDAFVRLSCDKSIVAKIEEKQGRIMEVCDLYFSSLFGQDEHQMVPMGDLSSTTPQTGSNPLLYTPLASSCRYPLLPIQADRTLDGIQLRGKLKEKEDSELRPERASGGAVRAGLGFFSSMLKKS
jgi:Vps51/Vps67